LTKTKDYNKALLKQAEKERVEQYAVYLELLAVEGMFIPHPLRLVAFHTIHCRKHQEFGNSTL
jgi:hypothetical protein